MGSERDGAEATGSGRRRGKGPVLDLTATDVTPATAAGVTDGGDPPADGAAATSADPAEQLFVPDPVAGSEKPAEAAAGDTTTGETPASGDLPAAGEPLSEAAVPVSDSTMEAAAGAAPDADRSDTYVPAETSGEAPAETGSDAAAPGTEPPAAADAPAANSSAGMSSAPHEPPTRPQPAERKSGGLSALMAAAVGGLIVLAGGAGLVGSGLVPLGPSAPSSAEAGPPPAAAADLAALSTRVDEIAAAASAQAAPDAALVERVAKLEAVATNSAGAPEVGAGDLAALAARVDAVEQALASQPQAATGNPDAPAAPAADPRIDALVARADVLANQLAAEVSRLDEAVKAVADRPIPADPAIAQLTEASAALSARLDAIGTMIEAIKAEAAASESRVVANLETATAPLGTRLDAIEARLDAGPKGGEIAALSLAVTTLASRVAEGRPFAADLAVIRAAMPDLAVDPVLEAAAAAGAPTIDALAGSFPMADIVAARPVSGEAGVMDHLLSGAQSLVNYRETDGSGDPAFAALAAIEAGLKAGDLAAVATAADSLPDWAKAAAADWLTRLSERRAADTAVAALTETVLARLQAPAEGQ